MEQGTIHDEWINLKNYKIEIQSNKKDIIQPIDNKIKNNINFPINSIIISYTIIIVVIIIAFSSHHKEIKITNYIYGLHI